MRRLAAAIGLLVCLASPVAASATDKPYSVLQRVPTAHGCMFASFTGTLHYNAVSDVVRGPRGSRRYRGLRVLDPTIAVWLMSSCRLTSAVYVRENAGLSVATAYHATSCMRMSLSEQLFLRARPGPRLQGEGRSHPRRVDDHTRLRHRLLAGGQPRVRQSHRRIGVLPHARRICIRDGHDDRSGEPGGRDGELRASGLHRMTIETTGPAALARAPGSTWSPMRDGVRLATDVYLPRRRARCRRCSCACPTTRAGATAGCRSSRRTSSPAATPSRRRTCAASSARRASRWPS